MIPVAYRLLEGVMASQPGFWDVEDRYAALSQAGDPLEKLSAVVDFEIFRSVLTKAIRRATGMGGGRPPYDLVLMFKVLVLQALYNLSDEQAEFMIRDRLSFLRFLGLGLSDKVPDARTIWLYRERLKKAGAIEALFTQFDDALHDRGFLAKGGQLLDATIIEAPRQRMDKEEREAVKAGKTPKTWSPKKEVSAPTLCGAFRPIRQPGPKEIGSELHAAPRCTIRRLSD